MATALTSTMELKPILPRPIFESGNELSTTAHQQHQNLSTSHGPVLSHPITTITTSKAAKAISSKANHGSLELTTYLRQLLPGFASSSMTISQPALQQHYNEESTAKALSSQAIHRQLTLELQYSFDSSHYQDSLIYGRTDNSSHTQMNR